MKITYTQIKSFLNQCVFNPKKPGPLSIIVDVGDSNYYRMRACEFVKEANDSITIDDYHDKLIKAIQLLILARATKIKELLGNES